MVGKDDWRLTNQEEYLFGKTLILKKFIPTKTDHEHCEFCWQKIMAKDTPDVVREAYSTENEYYWICIDCFNDFRDMFKWK
jgi:DNA-directed RNA polymerase subunit RPC12/RpoP